MRTPHPLLLDPDPPASAAGAPPASVPAAPAAPPAPPAPGASATPEPPKKTPTGADDPHFKALIHSMGKEKEDMVLENLKKLLPPEPATAATVTPVPTATASPASPASPAQPTPAPAAATGEPPKPVVVKKTRPIEEIVQESVTKALAAAQPKPPEPATSPTPPAPAPAADPDEAFIAALPASDQRSIEVARLAEKHLGKKGLPGQMVAYFRKINAYVADARAKEPDRTLDDTDEKLMEFIEQERPAELEPDNWDNLRVEAIAEERAEKKAAESAKKFEDRIAQTEHQQRVMQEAPVIERAAQGIATQVAADLMAAESPAAEVLKTVQSVGWDEAEKKAPIFVKPVRRAIEQVAGYAAEYLAISKGLVKVDLERNPNHAWLAEFLRRQGEFFKQNGGDNRIQVGRDGVRRQFATRGEYNTMKAEDQATHWTFNDDDVLMILRMNAKAEAETQIKGLREELQASGWAPTQATPQPPTPSPGSPAPVPAPSAATPQPVGSPKATVGAAPGPGAPGPPVPGAFSQAELARSLVPGMKWPG